MFEVKATGGDTLLGGDDFDQRIIEWLVERVQARRRQSTCGSTASRCSG